MTALAHGALATLVAVTWKVTGAIVLWLVGEAAAHLREAIGLGPADAAAHNNLAAVLVAQARFEEAVQRFSEAWRLEPQSAIRHNNLVSRWS